MPQDEPNFWDTHSEQEIRDQLVLGISKIIESFDGKFQAAVFRAKNNMATSSDFEELDRAFLDPNAR
jgi:hypothetical protein